ncbi:MAG: PTS sugar transporter subunit IIA [Sheuella sp.]|nr:PTS sugar transporter subunit IIA [Sheuella sp.]
MKILEFLHEQAVACELKAQSKDGIIRELVELLVRAGAVKDKDVDTIIDILKNREALGSTGIGQGVAIPHGKTNAVAQLVGAFGVSRAGVDFASLDGTPAHLFFLLIAPEDSAGPHLKALARISRLLKERHLRDHLKQARDEKVILKMFADEDQKRH